jgi:hypothetical protein
VPGDHPVAQDVVLAEAKFGGPVSHERIELDKRSGIEKEIETLTCGELSARVLALNSARSPTEERFGAHLVEAEQAFLVRRHVFSKHSAVLAQRRAAIIDAR